MRPRYLVHFSRSGEITLVDQNRQILGATISFFVHAVCLCCIIFASSSLSKLKPPMVIDFSIEKARVNTISNPTAKVVPTDLRPIRKTAATPSPRLPKPEIIARKVIPVETKKKIIEEKRAEPLIAEQPNVPVEEVQEQPEIEQEAVTNAAVKEVEYEDVIISEIPADTLRERPGRPAPKPGEMYIKEHFSYIKDSVQSQITYPMIARKMGWQGKVLISFVVCKDGSVRDIRIKESSGFKALDKNAVEVIRKVAPFPQPPVAAELIIPVVYKLG